MLQQLEIGGGGRIDQVLFIQQISYTGTKDELTTCELVVSPL